MCKALLPGDNESMSEEAIWETLPHFWVAISMIFFLTATVFTVLKLCGDIVAFGWWDLFINYGCYSLTLNSLLPSPFFLLAAMLKFGLFCFSIVLQSAFLFLSVQNGLIQ
ncbi:uncharacterized protein LOC111401431 [Olea europaea var. sylvestris]|uniref:uncharacterized protein LOC111401431 n=1 Tax=Olea europaea var. sylvestris TaxID=158386 RepID=UPI000C1D1E23|nr:uncharacterized protein LOC111401431 [Olea europaea var. sylvestris]